MTNFNFYSLIAVITVWALSCIMVLGSYKDFNREIELLNKAIQREVFIPRNEVGVASWYDYDLEGIEWSKTHRTCASRDIPKYKTARVTNLANGKTVDCYVNDYGPELRTGRQIDLSSFAFSQLAELSRGLINVKIETLN